jgi:hypothetical protein
VIRLASFLAFLLSSTLCWGAVARDSGNTDSTSFGTNVASVSWSHTVTAGSNLMIACDAAHKNSAVTGITYNSQALTLVDSETPGGDLVVEVWRRVGPSTGSNTAEISFSGNAFVVGACRSFSGVNQSSPFGTAVADSNTSSANLSATITIPAGGLGYDAGAQRTGVTCTGVTATGSNQTERYDLCDGGANVESVGGFGSTNTSTGSSAQSYTLTAGDGYIALIAAPINPATRRAIGPQIFQ